MESEVKLTSPAKCFIISLLCSNEGSPAVRWGGVKRQYRIRSTDGARLEGPHRLFFNNQTVDKCGRLE